MLSLFVVGSPSLASANGRFPDAQQLIVDPTDPNHIAVQTTYGFIQTRDLGANWTWTCEDAAGYGGSFDPPIAFVGDGALLAGVFDGLSQSSPDGCEWSFALEDGFFVDVSQDKQAPARAIALSSNGLGGNEFRTQVWRTDDASEWLPFGAQLPDDFLGLTLDAAPSDPNILYVSGFQILSSTEYAGMLAVSNDAGETWELRPVDGTSNEAGPYIGAIDPNDPETVYVRLSGLEGVLEVTHDGGLSWTTLFSMNEKMLGFALSPDGSELRVGGETEGLFGALVSEPTFSKLNDVGVRCITWTEGGLFICAREALAEFTVGQSDDGGASFEPIHHLACLDGPDPACAAESSIGACSGPWAAQKQLLQVDTCTEGQGGGGAGGATGGAGGGGGSGDSGEGCQCSLRSAAGPHRLASVLLLAGLVVARRRRPRTRPTTPRVDA